MKFGLFFSGYCRETNVRASIEIVGTQQVIFDVDSKDLVPLEEFTVDVAVCLGMNSTDGSGYPKSAEKWASSTSIKNPFLHGTSKYPKSRFRVPDPSLLYNINI